MSNGVDGTIRLRDGRRLATRNGAIAAAFRSSTSTVGPGRLEGRLAHQAARAKGVRLIAVDRPGMGLSDFQPRRTLVVGSFGAGAFAGSLLFGSVGRTWPRRRTFLSSYVVGAVLIYGTLALSPPLGIAIVAAVAAGAAFGPVNPIFATVTQENTPPHLLERVFGALTAIAQSAIPVGALLAGAVVQGAGLIPTIVGMGVVYVVVVIGMFFNPRLRGMDVRHEPVSEPTDSGAVQDGEALSASRRTDIR